MKELFIFLKICLKKKNTEKTCHLVVTISLPKIRLRPSVKNFICLCNTLISLNTIILDNITSRKVNNKTHNIV